MPFQLMSVIKPIICIICASLMFYLDGWIDDFRAVENQCA